MKTTANNNSETKKFYVIASSEYEANMPDLFIMNDNGEYFGVSGHSYAAWHNYPKSINFWMGAEGSDACFFPLYWMLFFSNIHALIQ